MSDLDDFFAKKDKKGKKSGTTKKKGFSNDDLDTKKFDEKTDKGKKITIKLEGYTQDEGEWNDFVDDENKDYSGLKIQTLSIKDKEEEQRDEEESTKKDQALPAWKEKEGGDQENKAEAEPKPKADPGSDDFISMFRNRRNLGLGHNAPKINDTIEFPDLGTPTEAYEEMKGFQTVRPSGVLGRSNGAGGNSEFIATDNKYNALVNNSN